MVHTGETLLQWLGLALLVSFLVSLRWFRTQTFPRSSPGRLRRATPAPPRRADGRRTAPPSPACATLRRPADACHVDNPPHARFCRACGSPL